MDISRIRNDIILIIALACAALAVWAVIKCTETHGAFAVVKIDGEEYARYSLETDVCIDITCGDGHVNTLVIKNGMAFISEADCPDKLCVKHKQISMAGESIICLPHKLVVYIEGGKAADIDG